MATDTVFITNKNDFHHTDMYDGQQFDFPPHEKVVLSTAAARHMFGLGLEDKTETLVRLGWAMKYSAEKKNFVENEEGSKHLARFVFTKAVMVEERLNSAAVDGLEIA